VGNQYTPIQNLEAFNFFDNIVSEGQAMFETVGALGLGERVWIMAKLPDDVVIADKDVINNYLLLHNTHDGSSTLTAQFTPVRVVCQNTLSLALKTGKHKIKIRHSRNAEERLKIAHELMGITRKVYVQTNELFTAMDARGVNKDEVMAYFDGLFDISKKAAERISKNKKRDNSRLSNIVEKCTELFEAGKGNHGKTLWDLYNGVTEWADHHRSLKDGEDRWVSGTFGSGVQIKEKAFELAQAML
jgi:phage/plasmid-like protein (TIGR03299 family)